MRKDRNIAIRMRRTGKTYNEIRDILKIPKSTLSDWFSKEGWSHDIRKKLTDAAYEVHKVRMRELDRIRGEHLYRVYQEARDEADQEFRALKYNPLFIAGMMLYSGEGDKLTKSSTRLTNTDPTLIKLFVLFLEKACQIPRHKIRGHILIYPDLEPQKCVEYWAEHSGLSVTDFIKCTTIQGRHKTKRLLWGVCMIDISSTYFKVKISRWLDLLPQELMSREYYASI